MKSLKTIADFERMIKKGEPFVVYKHSPICVVSDIACRKVETAVHHVDGANEVLYQVDVIKDRAVSNHIAEYSHVKHESPQVILFEKNDAGHMIASKNVSHGLISQAYVQGVVNKALGIKPQPKKIMPTRMAA